MSSSSNSGVKRSRSLLCIKDALDALNTVWWPFEDELSDSTWVRYEKRVEEIEKAHGVLAKAMFTNTDARIPTGPYIAFHEAMTAFLKTYATELRAYKVMELEDSDNWFDLFEHYVSPVFEKVLHAHRDMMDSLLGIEKRSTLATLARALKGFKAQFDLEFPTGELHDAYKLRLDDPKVILFSASWFNGLYSFVEFFKKHEKKWGSTWPTTFGGARPATHTLHNRLHKLRVAATEAEDEEEKPMKKLRPEIVDSDSEKSYTSSEEESDDEEDNDFVVRDEDV